MTERAQGKVSDWVNKLFIHRSHLIHGPWSLCRYLFCLGFMFKTRSPQSPCYSFYLYNCRTIRQSLRREKRGLVFTGGDTEREGVAPTQDGGNTVLESWSVVSSVPNRTRVPDSSLHTYRPLSSDSGPKHLLSVLRPSSRCQNNLKHFYPTEEGYITKRLTRVTTHTPTSL